MSCSFHHPRVTYHQDHSNLLRQLDQAMVPQSIQAEYNRLGKTLQVDMKIMIYRFLTEQINYHIA